MNISLGFHYATPLWPDGWVLAGTSGPEKGSETGQAAFSAPNCADLKGSALAAETIHNQVFVRSVGFSLVLEERVTVSLLSLQMLEPGLLATAACRRQEAALCLLRFCPQLGPLFHPGPSIRLQLRATRHDGRHLQFQHSEV